MTRRTFVHTSDVVAAMVLVVSMVTCLSLGQEVTGVVLVVTNTGNANYTRCMFADNGVNASFGIVGCLDLTMANMAACVTGIEAVASAGNTETGSAVPVVLLAPGDASGNLTAQAQLAAMVVSGANANGIAVPFNFADDATNATANIASIVTYATAFATALDAGADASMYFAVGVLAATCADSTSPPGGYLFAEAAADNLNGQLSSADTPGLRFVIEFDVASPPAAAARCGFSEANIVVDVAMLSLTGDCEDIPDDTYEAVSVSMAAAPTLSGDGGDGASGVWSLGLAAAAVASLVAFVL